MRGTLIIETGWCGFGLHTGLFPGVRVGIVQFAWCRGPLEARISVWLEQLRSMSALRGQG